MAKVEHYEGPGYTVACGRESATAVTSDKDKVTCKGCQRTKVFRGEQSGMDVLAELLSLDGVKTPAKVIDRTAVQTPGISPEADLYERARSLGYTDESAARVADAFAEIWGIYDPCPIHPAHSTTIRDGYAVDSCEACDVIKLSDDKGYTLAGWQATQAADKAAHVAYVNAELAKAADDECVCAVIYELGAANLPHGGMVCHGCGSVFTRSGEEASAEVVATSLAVIKRNQARQDADRQAIADERAWIVESEASWQAATSPTVDTDPDRCPKHGGYNIPGEAECAGCTWGDLVTRYQGTVEGKRAIGVAHSYAGRTHREGTAEYFYAAIDSITMAMAYSAEANNACRSTNHIYCVGPCPIRTRNEANASAARTTVETEAQCAARIKREDFRVGDAYTFRNLVGYRLYQDRPFACRGVTCQCGKACHGTTVESVEILTDVAHYVSGGLEIQGDKGSRAVIRADRLD